MSSETQTIIFSSSHGNIVTMDSAYDVSETNRDHDVVITASYCGVLPARFVSQHNPRAVIGVDCAIGPEGASISGLWYLEALNIPYVAVDIATVLLGNGVDVYENGIVSRLNRPALDCGVKVGMSSAIAAQVLLDAKPLSPSASEVTNRWVVFESKSGRKIVCTDSIAFALAEDRESSVLITAGHTGRSSVPYLDSARPFGFICSDGGMGRDRSGITGLFIVNDLGIPGATVDARTAQMGSGVSSYFHGIISACNALAEKKGVIVGMTAIEASKLLLEPDSSR